MGIILNKKIYNNDVHCICCKKLVQTKIFDCEHIYCDNCILKMNKRCPFCHCKLKIKSDIYFHKNVN